MRKVRDVDTELKALNERAKLLKQCKIQQFGELIEATGADALEPDLLAGGRGGDGQDTRAWAVARRERTRQLIELGGLVPKAGLVALADDDRASLYGAFLDLAIRLRGDDGAQTRSLYRWRGARAFATGAELEKSRRSAAALNSSSVQSAPRKDWHPVFWRLAFR